MTDRPGDERGEPGGRLPGPRATVLLVEDEDMVRRVVRKQLEREGFRVLEARGGEAALAMVEAGEPVDVVLIDVVMPGMSGPDLLVRLRQLLPEVRALFVSGYPRETLGERTPVPESSAFLLKPFTREELARAVSEALRAPPERPITPA